MSEKENPLPNRAYDEFGQHTHEHIEAGVAISTTINELFNILASHGFNARESYNIIQPEVFVRARQLAESQRPKKEKT